MKVVRDDDHGEALLAQPAHEREHLLGLCDPERRGRLVEDHELGVPLDGLRDRDGLPLAARQRCDRPQDRRNRRDGERLQRRGRALCHLGLVQDLPAVQLAAEVHVLDDVEVVAESEILVDDLDPEARRVLRPVDADRLALEEDLAAVGGVRAGDGLHERGLARAVVADERHHLAAPDLEVDVGERLHRPEGLRDVTKLEKWGFLVGHPEAILTRKKNRWRRHLDASTGDRAISV